MGKTVSLVDSRKDTERAEVWAVTPNGERVNIYDKYVPFRTFN